MELNSSEDSRSAPADLVKDPPGSQGGLVSLPSQLDEARNALQQANARIFQLQELNAALEQTVLQRTAEAERRAGELRALVAELSQAEQRERRRLAKLLHDHIQQLLVAARMQANALERRIIDENHRKLLHQLDELLHQAMQASRTLTVELSPPVLQEGGLAGALEWLACWMQEKHGLEVQLDLLEENITTGEEVRFMLFEATRELLFNVVKHSGVCRASLTLRHLEANRVEIVVSDEGQGFDSSQPLAPFQSVNAGFGLFNVRERVEWLEGSFEIHSSPGKGTTVRLLVPAQVAKAPGAGTGPAKPELEAGTPGHPPPAPARIVNPSSPNHTIRVLLADDHQIMREGLAGLLEFETDIQVVGEASDGLDAVEAARRLHPDVIVMDISMPRLNGVEATRRIKNEMSDIRIIGLSMHTESDMAEEMRAAGASAFLTKGGPSEALVSAIRGESWDVKH